MISEEERSTDEQTQKAEAIRAFLRRQEVMDALHFIDQKLPINNPFFLGSTVYYPELPATSQYGIYLWSDGPVRENTQYHYLAIQLRNNIPTAVRVINERPYAGSGIDIRLLDYNEIGRPETLLSKVSVDEMTQGFDLAFGATQKVIDRFIRERDTIFSKENRHLPKWATYIPPMAYRDLNDPFNVDKWHR